MKNRNNINKKNSNLSNQQLSMNEVFYKLYNEAEEEVAKEKRELKNK